MTIYALSSGPGISGIAVIRVSGKNTAEVIKKITSRTKAIVPMHWGGHMCDMEKISKIAKITKNNPELEVLLDSIMNTSDRGIIR